MSELSMKISERGGRIENWYHFAEVEQYAREKGLLDKLTSALTYACFPSFFGTPSKTEIYPDSSPHSFYFEIKNKETGVMLMNGGVIWHESSQDWGVHT